MEYLLYENNIETDVCDKICTEKFVCVHEICKDYHCFELNCPIRG